VIAQGTPQLSPALYDVVFYSLKANSSAIDKNSLNQANKLRGFSPQSELYRLSNRRLSAKLVPTLADRGCRVVSATNPHGS
jgi:hypothetical protein